MELTIAVPYLFDLRTANAFNNARNVQLYGSIVKFVILVSGLYRALEESYTNGYGVHTTASQAEQSIVCSPPSQPYMVIGTIVNPTLDYSHTCLVFVEYGKK